MTIIFAGGEQDAFDFIGNAVVSTSTTRRDVDFTRVAMIPRATGFIQGDFSAQTEGWVHIVISPNAVGSASQDGAVVRLVDSVAAITVCQIDTDNGIFNLEYNNGAIFVELAPAIPMLAGILNKIDINFKIADSGGFFKVYHNGVLVSSFTGDTLPAASFTQINRIQFLSPVPSSSSSVWDIYYSEVIVATVETIGWHLATVSPDGVGTSTTWTGDNTDVDDATLDDITFVSSSTAEELEQFSVTNLSVTASALAVEAVIVAARSRNAATGPQNVQVNVRTGGSDFFSGNLSGVSAGFTIDQNVWDQNPNTVADWTPAEIDLLQIGVKSKA